MVITGVFEHVHPTYQKKRMNMKIAGGLLEVVFNSSYRYDKLEPFTNPNEKDCKQNSS